MCEVINFPVQKKKHDFSEVSGEVRENLLMETAMRIQEIFDDMFYARLLDPEKVEHVGSIERSQSFRDWAREFEETYYGTEEYEDDFISLSDAYAVNKISEKFGN